MIAGVRSKIRSVSFQRGFETLLLVLKPRYFGVHAVDLRLQVTRISHTEGKKREEEGQEKREMKTKCVAVFVFLVGGGTQKISYRQNRPISFEHHLSPLSRVC